MSSYFGKHTLHDAFKVISGIGTISIPVPFLPDYVKVDFHGSAMTPKEEIMGDDEVYWNLVKITPNSYQLDIGWSVYTTREIYYRVARLTVDPV